MIILINTLPRTGSNKLSISIFETFKIYFTKKRVSIIDLDLQEKKNREIQLSVNLNQILILKTHQHENLILEKYLSSEISQVLILNIIRCPFDIAVSAYYYLTKNWKLFDESEVSLFKFLCEWAEMDGNCDIFKNFNFPSFNEYINNILNSQYTSDGSRIVIGFRDLIYSPNKIFSSILDKVLNTVNCSNVDKNLMTNKFNEIVNLSLEDIKKIFGEKFIYKGGCDYSKDIDLIRKITPQKYVELFYIYLNKFKRNIEIINKKFNLKEKFF